MRISQALLNKYSIENGLPPAPGTTPIPAGHIRLFHQTTPENATQISKEGIKLSSAKGIEGPRAIYATPKPFYGSASDVPTVEFHVPQERFTAPQNVMGDVTPDEIIAIHLPWHTHARYMIENKDVLQKVISGEYDYLLGTPDYGEAIRYIKKMYGAHNKVQS